MVDLELQKIDKKRKLKDDKELLEYKATLKNDMGDIKLVVKKSSKSNLENIIGPTKVGNRIQMKLNNTQSKLDDHIEPDDKKQFKEGLAEQNELPEDIEEPGEE